MGVPRFHTATKLFLFFPLPFSFHEVFLFSFRWPFHNSKVARRIFSKVFEGWALVAHLFTKSVCTISFLEVEQLCCLKQWKCDRKLSLAEGRHKYSVQSFEDISG